MSDNSSDPIAYRIFNEIGIIDQLASTAFRRVLPPPLNSAMFGVLNHFVRLGDGKTPGELASAFQVTRPSMTNTVEKLLAAGFVRVETGSEDARTKIVWITPEGRKARNGAVKATADLFANIAPALEAIDQDRLLETLCQLRSILDQNR